MSPRWLRNPGTIDCDLVLPDGALVRTVELPVVPQVGDELALDLPGMPAEGALYRVIRVRHHVRPRRLTTRDDLFGVTLFIEPTG